MTDAEAKAVAEAVVAALGPQGRPHTVPAPKSNGHLMRWVVGVAVGLAVAAGGGGLLTWRGLAVVEAKQMTMDKVIGEVQADTKYLRSSMDQLLGRLDVRPVKP